MYRFYLIIAVGLLGLIPVLKKWKFSFWMIFPYYALRLSYVLFLMSRGMIGNDVRGWVEHGLRIAGGEVPSLDFITPYGLLFNVVLGASASVWARPFMLAIVFSMFEMSGVMLFYDMMKRERVLLAFRSPVMWLYLTSPLVMMYFGWDVQDEGILLFFVSLCCWLWMRGRENLLPVAMVFAVLSTKILAVIYLAPLLLLARFRQMLRFGICMALVWAVELLCGLHPFDLRFERLSGTFDQIPEIITSGNVWYLLTHLAGICPPGALCNAVYVAATAGLALCCMTAARGAAESRRENLAGLMLSLSGLSLMSFFKMSPPCYFLPVLLPALLWFVSHFSLRAVAVPLVLVELMAMREWWRTLLPSVGETLTSCVLVPSFLFGIYLLLRHIHQLGGRVRQIPRAVLSYVSTLRRVRN